MDFNKLLNMSTFLAAAVLAVACGGNADPENKPGGEEKPVEPVKTEITAPVVSDIQPKSVTVSSTTTMSADKITKKGFVYSEKENPTISAYNVVCTGSDFKASLSGLKAGTTYYVRAYIMAGSTSYSEQTKFETAASSDLDDYIAPKYADDYRSISDWSHRAEWNLANVHDPTVMLADDGYYYMYQTDASFGNAHEGHGHLHGRRSKNLIDWEYLGATLNSTPSWVLAKCNEYRTALGLPAVTQPQNAFWAPTARKVTVGGKTVYRMYYSVIMDNYIGNGKPVSTAFDGTWTERAYIGMMETADPASNKWEDKGFVICSSSDLGKNWKRSSQTDWDGYFKFNAIDPSYIVTPEGEHWLIYGSWHSGIAAVQLNPETGKTLAELPNPWGTADEIAPYGKQIETRGGRWQGSEGPEVVYHDGYYYLFIAYDELSVAYNTRVVRSKNVDGPYVDINGSSAIDLVQAYPIETHPYRFSKGSGWVGISHCAVFDDGNDNWFFASQGRFPDNAGGAAPNAVMLGQIRRIIWTETGWPIVLPERYGAVPQNEIRKEDIVGTWEHIDLSYKYAEQRTSVTMSFTADGKISGGPWNGATWTFDAAKNTVTTSNGVTLYLSRECDWEATPRTQTIVYGAHGKDKTYWGKKI